MTRRYVVSGIYAITNAINGKQYVGSAQDMDARWGVHQWYLRKGIHDNPHLQAAYKLYGLEAFTFTILERVADLGALEEREQHWLDTLRPAYNIRRTAINNRGLRHTEATRQKQREGRYRALARDPDHLPHGADHWLHKRPDEALRGENNGHAKLTADQVAEIRWRYAFEHLTWQQLADEYGVGQTTIGNIIRRITWQHL